MAVGSFALIVLISGALVTVRVVEKTLGLHFSGHTRLVLQRVALGRRWA